MNVVFIFSEFSLHNQIIEEYVAARPGDQISIVKVPLVVRGKGRLKTAETILPKLPNRFVLGKIVEFLSVGLITFVPKILNRGAVFKRLSRIAKHLSASYLEVADINSPQSLKFIREQNPDLIFTLFHQIIREELIGVPKIAIVNAHPGLLPNYRGIQPYFWQLGTGFSHSGATFHLIEDTGVDTGRILAQGSYPNHPGTSVQLNYFLTAKLIGAMLPKLADKLGSGFKFVSAEEQKEKGNYYKWPTSEAIDDLYRLGYLLISLNQLFGILTGRYDKISSEERYLI